MTTTPTLDTSDADNNGLPIDLDFSDAEESLVIPQPENMIGAPEETIPTSDAAPMSAAERVKQRLRNGAGRGGKSPGIPRTKRESKSRPVPPKPREGSLVKPLTQIYVSMGMMIVPFDQACGQAVIQNAEQCAKALEALARENEAVRRAILALTQTSAWGGVVIAHLPILLMVTVHHGPKPVAEAVAPMAQMLNTPGAMDNLATVSDEDENA